MIARVSQASDEIRPREGNVNLRHLQVFCTVVDCESFSAAAEQLIMTQPAVSMQVQAVEHYFGVQLLERRHRRTVLTEAGRVVHEWARQVLDSETAIHKVVDELKHAHSGRVVVGASMSVGSRVLPSILSNFKRSHTGAEIVVRLGERQEVCGEILAGSVDCGVLIAREIPTELAVEILGSEEAVLFCGPSHRLANEQEVCISDVAEEAFILAPRGSGYRRVIDVLLAEQGLTNVSVLMEFEGADSVKHAVEQGMGVGVALRSNIQWELDNGLLREVALPVPRPLVELGLVHDPRRLQSPMLHAFTEYLRDQLRQKLRTPQDQPSEEHREDRPRHAPRATAGRLAHHR
jgi:DNA-binding transcriptional LysR family regulator